MGAKNVLRNGMIQACTDNARDEWKTESREDSKKYLETCLETWIPDFLCDKNSWWEQLNGSQNYNCPSLHSFKIMKFDMEKMLDEIEEIKKENN